MENNSVLQNIFEQIALDSSKWNKNRQCREMIVPSNIKDIKQGEYCELIVGGGGCYCQWYYYHTLDNRHMLIFRSPNNNNNNNYKYSGREIFEIPTSFGILENNENNENDENVKNISYDIIFENLLETTT